MNCTFFHGAPPSFCLPHPSLLNTVPRFDGIFQSWLWCRGSAWHTGDFLVDSEHLLSSCWIPPRDTIKPLPTQLVFTGGCFASSKTTFFLLLQVKAERMHMKTFQIWNKHFHKGSYDARLHLWLTQAIEWTSHARIKVEEDPLLGGAEWDLQAADEKGKGSHNWCWFIISGGLLRLVNTYSWRSELTMHRPERGKKKCSSPGTVVADEAPVCFFVWFLWHQNGFYVKLESCER